MKTYKIGRNTDNDIVINDETRLVSRYHAILKVNKNGKMTICDISSNGTYINSEKIKSNMHVEESKSDIVFFAKKSQLDWSMIEFPENISSKKSPDNKIYNEDIELQAQKIKQTKSNRTSKLLGWLLIFVGIITVFTTGFNWSFEVISTLAVSFIGGIILLVKDGDKEK